MFGVSHGAIQFMTYEEMKNKYNQYRNVPIDTKMVRVDADHVDELTHICKLNEHCDGNANSKNESTEQSFVAIFEDTIDSFIFIHFSNVRSK